MYRAVSLALYARTRYPWNRSSQLSVSHHTVLRKKVADEIRDNQIWYDRDIPNFASPLANEPRISLSKHSDYVEETPKDGSPSDINHIYALSAVINEPIHCFFPSTNPNNNPFQRVVIGRGVKDAKVYEEEKIHIMWTATVLPSPLKIQNLMIDRFVPLVFKFGLPTRILNSIKGNFYYHTIFGIFMKDYIECSYHDEYFSNLHILQT